MPTHDETLAQAKALAAPLPPSMRSLLDAAMAKGHLWGLGNSTAFGAPRVHLIRWASSADQRVTELFQGRTVEAADGRYRAHLAPPPGGSQEFDSWSIPKGLSDDEKRCIRERYAAEMLHRIEVQGATDDICNMCRRVADGMGLTEPD